MSRVNGFPSELTDCGLPGIRELPYGVHMCHVYSDRDELLAALARYFAAGLRQAERCIWVASHPLTCALARDALAAADADVATALENNQISILSDAELYLRGGRMNAQEVCAYWLAEEEKALADGYRGLRICGNPAFVTQEKWPAFMDYEEACSKAFRGRRIVALCCYDKQACGAAEIFEIVGRHCCALDRPDEGWQIITRTAA